MTYVKELIEFGDQLFGKRSTLMTLWQDIADNFYPERADFTVSRDIGDEFASNLMSSYPLIVRRELGNAFSAMLRPRDRKWFSITVDREERLDNAGRAWLEQASDIQRRAMYDRQAQFVRATKEGDNDFATFGQCVISRDIDWRLNTLLYRSWHLRDVAWCEDYSGKVDEVHRKWKPFLRDLNKLFPGKLHANTQKRLEKEPYCQIECRHIVVPGDNYQGETQYRAPYVSLFVDVEQQHVMEVTGRHALGYTIPRWQTVSGSQYAYSPATVAALPDARLLQAMTLTLLEAGETAVRPPLVATQDVVRGDVALYAGGITWVDAEYDERLGDALRPLTKDHRGLPFGAEMADGVKQLLAAAFFLNKLTLPPAEHDMTAYETQQRVQEHIRSVLPLFEPMEAEYNGALCEDTFDALMRVGAFGPVDEIPDSIRGSEVRFLFESPLHAALKREKAAKFGEAREMLLAAVELDPDAQYDLDVRKALRDALDGAGVDAKWMRNEEEADALASEADMARRAAAVAQIGEQAGKAVEQAGKAQQALQ